MNQLLLDIFPEDSRPILIKLLKTLLYIFLAMKMWYLQIAYFQEEFVLIETLSDQFQLFLFWSIIMFNVAVISFVKSVFIFTYKLIRKLINKLQNTKGYSK